ncbi:uncharacterized protein LOC122511051 [Leptopilina heterotoma]|uniref:uncharacterized protein LOC122511051 n=1 Tax=Leptopilina heterotoma TaxID=63436 RepID=UPI001CA908AF|nr:uncharacterized protein LOC122511051 [Leptopilina heterotoma]XP_043482014.1 uncharacterized protein LOC122511051 [Leptopilina heterotoma]XP_043482015.1 uncharacterized protein LOC122511051 [Leptopilina heterotoma]XP_043482016.1 uncharacterized protein LOC122511051 [Leptopilina heterotoma]XP_043482017.1 uncharacterized protein LOC122511051 [Leptopilina heterotoma]
MPRRGLMSRRSTSKHRATEEFQLPKDYSKPPSILDFPIHDQGKEKSLGAISRRSNNDQGQGSIINVNGSASIDPMLLPKGKIAEENPRRKKNESWGEYGSRLAVEELDRFMKNIEPKTSVKIEELKELQMEEIERRKHVLKKEDVVHPNDEDDVTMSRCSTPPGPPINVNPKNIETDQIVIREALPRKTTGVMFNDLVSIPTDPTIDPPPRCCQNCWRKGHKKSQCTKKVTEAHCDNCGRKYVTVANCPRCAPGYRKYLMRGKRNYRSDEACAVLEEDYGNKRMNQRRDGNLLLPPMWTKEVNLGSNLDGRGNSERAWNIPRSPSPPSSNSSLIESSQIHKISKKVLKEWEIRSEVIKNEMDESVLSDEQKNDPPPSYNEVEPTIERPLDLIAAIREITMVMEGLPAETINMAVQQLILERKKSMDNN